MLKPKRDLNKLFNRCRRKEEAVFQIVFGMMRARYEQDHIDADVFFEKVETALEMVEEMQKEKRAI